MTIAELNFTQEEANEINEALRTKVNDLRKGRYGLSDENEKRAIELQRVQRKIQAVYGL